MCLSAPDGIHAGQEKAVDTAVCPACNPAVPHDVPTVAVFLAKKVWWDRVVADGAQILANQRSARAVAALSLVGSARWCVVERENMAAVETSSERMRVSFRCLGWRGGAMC